MPWRTLMTADGLQMTADLRPSALFNQRPSASTLVFHLQDPGDALDGFAEARVRLDEGEPDVALAVLPEAAAGRRHDAGFLHEECRELERRQRAELGRDLRPHVEGSLRHGHLPPDPLEKRHERVPPSLIRRDRPLDVVLRAG